VLFTRENFASAGQARSLATAVSRAARATHPVPTLLAADQSGGPATAFPSLPPRSQPRVGARGRPALARRQAFAAGVALRRLGIAMTLAPVADVDVPSGAVSAETFSGDPAVVARFTSAALAGYSSARTLAAIGHFPGEGSASQDPDLQVGSVGESLAELRRRDEVPFAAVARRAPAIVLSNALYAAFDGVTPASLLPAVVGELRGRVQFHGVVVSSDLGAAVLATGGSVGQAAVQAIAAGVDLVYVSGGPHAQEEAYRAVLSAARRGAIPAARLDGALARVLALKMPARAAAPRGRRRVRPRGGRRTRGRGSARPRTRGRHRRGGHSPTASR
jgi:beta-N-acetylhexosaminidase